MEILGRCHLCLHECVLVDSHVLPRWFYSKFLKKDGYYISADLVNGKVANEEQDHKEPLMCGPCDRSFKNIESYMRLQFQKWMDVPVPGNLSLPVIPRSITVTYRNVKLFGLLTLWRMAISGLPFFAKVEPGPDICEQLRVLLKSLDPGPASLFPMMVLVDQSGRFKRGASYPQWNDHGLTWFAGGVWTLILPGQQSEVWRRVTLQENGVLPLDMADARDHEWVKRMLGTIRENNRRASPHPRMVR